MDYTKIKLFSMAKTNMDYLAARQDVLAKSIASVDMPGYKAKDLKPLDFDKLASEFARKLEMKTTSSGHKKAPEASGGEFKVVKERQTYEIKPIGNSVSTEEQMMKVNETAFDYMTMTSLYSKTAMLFKTAIGNR